MHVFIYFIFKRSEPNPRTKMEYYTLAALLDATWFYIYCVVYAWLMLETLYANLGRLIKGITGS
jgi:hypothetical protein